MVQVITPPAMMKRAGTQGLVPGAEGAPDHEPPAAVARGVVKPKPIPVWAEPASHVDLVGTV
jgi:hypothetical protein